MNDMSWNEYFVFRYWFDGWRAPVIGWRKVSMQQKIELDMFEYGTEE